MRCPTAPCPAQLPSGRTVRDSLTVRPIGEDALEAAVCFTQMPQAVPAFRPGEDGGERKGERPRPV